MQAETPQWLYLDTHSQPAQIPTKRSHCITSSALHGPSTYLIIYTHVHQSICEPAIDSSQGAINHDTKVWRMVHVVDSQPRGREGKAGEPAPPTRETTHTHPGHESRLLPYSHTTQHDTHTRMRHERTEALIGQSVIMYIHTYILSSLAPPFMHIHRAIHHQNLVITAGCLSCPPPNEEGAVVSDLPSIVGSRSGSVGATVSAVWAGDGASVRVMPG